MLRQTQGALRLVDASKALPDFPRVPGLNQWCVKGSKGKYFTDYEEAEKVICKYSTTAQMLVNSSPVGCYCSKVSIRASTAVQANHQNPFSPSMFPEETEGLGLERCMRVLPHHADTGGFFIAVFEKLKELPQPQPDR